MEAWSRFRDSFSSLPTTSPSSSSSSTPSSSSASLQPSPLLDLADELWFYSSVVPLPSFSLSCFPSCFSSSPDPSTLIAQCMITNFSPSSTSSSLTPPPASCLKFQNPHPSLFPSAYDALPAPTDIHETCTNTFFPYGYGAESSLSESDESEDVDVYRGYAHSNAGDDDEGHYYYTAPSDWDDEDAHHGYHVPSDSSEDEQQVHATKLEAQPADFPQRRLHHAPDDALSGVYDTGALLKNQHQRRSTSNISYSRAEREGAPRGSFRRPKQARSHKEEQKEVKESLKLWAHVVVSRLATQGRPLL